MLRQYVLAPGNAMGPLLLSFSSSDKLWSNLTLSCVVFSVLVGSAGHVNLFDGLDLDPAGAKLEKQQIRPFSPYAGLINTDDSLLVTAEERSDISLLLSTIQITVYDARVPAKLVKLQRSIEDVRNPFVFGTLENWDLYSGSSWLSLGDGVGILVIPLRVMGFLPEHPNHNFDGYVLYDVSRSTGVSLRFNITHMESKEYSECYENTRLAEGVFVRNGIITTMKGKTVVATNLTTGKTLWKREIPNNCN